MSLLWLVVLLMLANMMMTMMRKRKRERKKTNDNKRLFFKLDSSFVVLYHTVGLILLDNMNSSINNMMKACICGAEWLRHQFWLGDIFFAYWPFYVKTHFKCHSKPMAKEISVFHPHHYVPDILIWWHFLEHLTVCIISCLFQSIAISMQTNQSLIKKRIKFHRMRFVFFIISFQSIERFHCVVHSSSPNDVTQVI